MKKKVFLLLACITIAHSQILAQLSFSYQADVPTILVKYNPSCMKKFKYKTDPDYVVEDSYTNYHLPIDGEHTLILKVLESEQTLSNLDTRHLLKLNCFSSQSIGHNFVERVNTGNTIIYLLEEHSKDSSTIYHVDHTIYQEMNTHNMRFFSPPYFSFIYDYDIEHFPGDNLPADDADPRKFDTRFYLYGEETVGNIRNDVLLKMYYDACYNREIAITTELSPVGEINSYKSVTDPKTGKFLYRSCQHPIHSEYLKGIGLYKETYYEDGKPFVSELVSIDDIPIQEYLKLVSDNYTFENYNDNVSLDTSTEKVYKLKGENTAKGGIDLNGNKKDFYQPENRATNLKIHIVSKGETLYRLSKQYNISIAEIKLLNELDDNTIYVNQHLMIKAN